MAHRLCDTVTFVAFDKRSVNQKRSVVGLFLQILFDSKSLSIWSDLMMSELMLKLGKSLLCILISTELLKKTQKTKQTKNKNVHKFNFLKFF